MALELLDKTGQPLQIVDGETILVQHDFRDENDQVITPETLRLIIWDEDDPSGIFGDVDRTADIPGLESSVGGTLTQLLGGKPLRGDFQIRRMLWIWTWASGANENRADRSFRIKRLPITVS